MTHNQWLHTILLILWQWFMTLIQVHACAAFSPPTHTVAQSHTTMTHNHWLRTILQILWQWFMTSIQVHTQAASSPPTHTHYTVPQYHTIMTHNQWLFTILLILWQSHMASIQVHKCAAFSPPTHTYYTVAQFHKKTSFSTKTLHSSTTTINVVHCVSHFKTIIYSYPLILIAYHSLHPTPSVTTLFYKSNAQNVCLPYRIILVLTL